MHIFPILQSRVFLALYLHDSILPLHLWQLETAPEGILLQKRRNFHALLACVRRHLELETRSLKWD